MKVSTGLLVLLLSIGSSTAWAGLVFEDTFSDGVLTTSDDVLSDGFSKDGTDSLITEADGLQKLAVSNAASWSAYRLDSVKTFSVEAGGDGFQATWIITGLNVPEGWANAAGICLSVQQGAGYMIGTGSLSSNAKEGLYVVFNDYHGGDDTIWVREVLNTDGSSATATDHVITRVGSGPTGEFEGTGTVALAASAANGWSLNLAGFGAYDDLYSGTLSNDYSTLFDGNLNVHHELRKSNLDAGDHRYIYIDSSRVKTAVALDDDLLLYDTHSDGNLETSDDALLSDGVVVHRDSETLILESGGAAHLAVNNSVGWKNYWCDSKRTVSVADEWGCQITWEVSGLDVPDGYANAGGIALSLQQGGGDMIGTGSLNADASEGLYVMFNDRRGGDDTIWVREVLNTDGSSASATDHVITRQVNGPTAEFTGSGSITLQAFAENTWKLTVLGFGSYDGTYSGNLGNGYDTLLEGALNAQYELRKSNTDNGVHRYIYIDSVEVRSLKPKGTMIVIQ